MGFHDGLNGPKGSQGTLVVVFKLTPLRNASKPPDDERYLHVWPVNPDTNFVLRLSAGVRGATFNSESILILPSLRQ